MPPTPKPRGAELAERLTLVSAADPVDEVALRRIVAETNKLMGADPAMGHALLGRVAALRWDIDEMKRRHRLAVPLGDPGLSRIDFANSLALVGLIDEAYDVALGAFECAPDDLLVLRLLIDVALLSGRLRDAQRYVSRWRKLSPKEDAPHAEHIESLRVALDQGLFSESGVRGILRVAAATLASSHVRGHRISISESYHEASSFLMTVYVIASSSRAADLNCELASRWAESPVLMADPGLRFKPMFIGMFGNGDHT